MNFRQWLLRVCTQGCGLLMVLSMLAIVRPASASVSIPGEIKSSADADKHRTEIAAVVTANITDLTGDDVTKRDKAREQLSVEVNAPDSSAAFLDTYAQELNTQLLKVADNSDPRVRLNAAIVVARVAERTGSTRLLDVTEKLLADKSDAVLIWALKAAQFVLPPLLQTGLPQQQQKLIADIKSHADNPILLPLVYDALSPSPAKVTAQAWNKMVPTALKEMTGLLKSRLDQYRKEIPSEPAADKEAVNFLSSVKVWSAAKQDQQLQIVQLLSDLYSLAGHRAATVPSGAVRDQLAQCATQAGQGLAAVALISGNPTLEQDLERTTKVDPTNPNVNQVIDAVYPKLKAVTAWAALQPPAKIEAATTAPATSSPATAAAK